MTGNADRNVQIKLEVKKVGDQFSAFKDLEKGAKAVAKSVKDIAPVAKTTTDTLRKMFSDTKDQAAGAEVKINRLSKSIVELGLKTKDVARIAKEMGQQWQLSAAQIDAALAKAGQGPMGGGGGFWTKERSGIGVGSSLGMGYAALRGSMEAKSYAGNVRRGFSSDRYVQPKGDGTLWGMAESAHDAFLANEFTGERGWSPTDQQLRLRGQQGERQANRDFQAESRAQRESAQAERLGIKQPFVDFQRAARRQVGGLRDEAAGLRGMSSVRDRITAERTREGVGFVNTAAAMAPDLFKRPGEQEALRGQREQMREMAKGHGESEAAAAKDVTVAQQNAVRLAAEETSIRKQLAENRKIETDEIRTQGKVVSAVYAQRANLEQQLSQITAKQREAQQAITAALQNQNQTRRENLTQAKELAKQNEQYYRNIATQEREKIRSDKIGLGLGTEEEKEKTLSVSRAIKAGEELSPEQMQFAKGQSVFRDSLEKIGLQKAEADPRIREILGNVGAEAKAQQAEQAAKFFADIKVQMDTKINAEIKINEESLAKQLVEQLVPQILRAIEDSKKAAETAMERQQIAAGANRRNITQAP